MFRVASAGLAGFCGSVGFLFLVFLFVKAICIALCF